MIIDLVRLREGKLPLADSYPSDIFELDEQESLQAENFVSYDLEANLYGTELAIQGILECSFLTQCTGCLQQFSMPIKLANYHLEQPVEGGSKGASIDLTERIREDILLALPGYPRCDRHGQDGQQATACPINEQLSDQEPGEGDSDWDALDGLKTSK